MTRSGWSTRRPLSYDSARPRAELRSALCVATGDLRKRCHLREHTDAVVVAEGPWRGYLLMVDRHFMTLRDRGDGAVVWMAETPPRAPVDPAVVYTHRETIVTGRGEWFSIQSVSEYTKPCCYTLRNGTQVPSVFDGTSPKHSVLVVDSPDRAIVTEWDFLFAKTVVTTLSRGYPPTGFHMRGYDWRALPQTAPHSRLTAFAGSSGNIHVVGQGMKAVVSSRDTPDSVAAWHWTPRQYCQRECAAAANAIAAVDELAAASEPEAAIGLVRAVLVGFIAEDAHLTALQLERAF